MNASKPIVPTRHAMSVIQERQLETHWIERTVRMPDWVETDKADTGIERRFRAVPEREGRILRVVVIETDEEYRIISAFLDRRARKPR